jgi:hypothetical protein
VSENVQKLIGVVVMAVLVVVGVAVSSGDDTDYTRNVSFRDNPERLEGGDRLGDPDCCDQNAYEILKLQNDYMTLKEQMDFVEGSLEKAQNDYMTLKEQTGFVEGSLEKAQSTIEKLKEGACGDAEDRPCIEMGHTSLVQKMSNVGAAWKSTLKGSWECNLLQDAVNYAAEAVKDESYGAIDATGQDFCSEEKFYISGAGGVKQTALYGDQFLKIYLHCSSRINLFDNPVGQGKYLANPNFMTFYANNDDYIYAIAPGTARISKAIFQLSEDGMGQKVVGLSEFIPFFYYDWAELGEFQHGSLQVRITNKQTQDHHLLLVVPSMRYTVVEGDAESIKAGDAKARCEADLTFIRNYDEE